MFVVNCYLLKLVSSVIVLQYNYTGKELKFAKKPKLKRDGE